MFSASKSKGASSGYQIANSLRFRSSASAYLNRTPSVAGNRTTWTWSGWVKRGTLGSAQIVLDCDGGTTDATFGAFGFTTADAFEFLAYTTVWRVTSQVFRDPSAWYHIVLAFDTTQATATNRVKIYLNGFEITAFSTSNNPTQNASYAINQAAVHNIAKLYGGRGYFDGYMADINFIDGQALTPSSFGQINATTGVWQPIRYSGTYGTNGFKLNFSNGTSTTTLGYDSSGNSNNWTTNNISLTAGSTYDWMLDSPTPFVGTSYGVGNYAVLNPLGKSAYASISSGNLNISWSDNASAQFAANPASITFPNSGKWYFELSNASADGNNAIGVGICPITQIANGGNSSPSTYYLYRSDATPTFNGYQSNSGTAGSGSTFLGGAICGIAVDLDNGKFWASINNTWQGGGNPASGTSPGFSGISSTTVWVPFVGGWEWTGTATSASINFGQRPFSYTPPTGYKSLCTLNLPAPSIQNGAAYMAATTYTGTGASLSVSGAAFQPDLVWIKSRSAATDHALYDVIRGTQNRLESNTTDAAVASDNGLTAFGSAGFTVNTLAQVNTNAATYVGWQWKAGGTAVSNTAGSITSSVSANTTSGFSVVTYTGTGANATVGHGLGVAPSMVITKKRSSTSDWGVYHSSLTSAAYYLLLDSAAAQASGATYWNSTAPTSTVFSVGTADPTNISTATYVAYCFAAIPGYSAFGSYTGNGSTDGPFVYCGFRPRFVLVKLTSAAGSSWTLLDTSRSTYNVTDNVLRPDTAGAEFSGNNTMDILSNGFKLRTTWGDANTSSATYIYAAFAENPFQNSLAR